MKQQRPARVYAARSRVRVYTARSGVWVRSPAGASGYLLKIAPLGLVHHAPIRGSQQDEHGAEAQRMPRRPRDRAGSSQDSAACMQALRPGFEHLACPFFFISWPPLWKKEIMAARTSSSTHLVAQVLLALSLKFLQVRVTESECVREGTRACERARGREGTKERKRGGGAGVRVCVYI